MNREPAKIDALMQGRQPRRKCGCRRWARRLSRSSLESHAGSLPAAKRALVTSAVKRVVTSAWEIDGYGDLGNRTKIVEAYQRMATAVADLKAAYEGSR